MNEYEILLIWDEEARVWIAQNDDIPHIPMIDSICINQRLKQKE
jgi:hypothetical protein